MVMITMHYGSINKILTWDVNEDMEGDYFEVSPFAQVFFDFKGNEYILDQDNITIVDTGGRCKSFNISINEFDQRFLFKGIEYG